MVTMWINNKTKMANELEKCLLLVAAIGLLVLAAGPIEANTDTEDCQFEEARNKTVIVVDNYHPPEDDIEFWRCNKNWHEFFPSRYIQPGSRDLCELECEIHLEIGDPVDSNYKCYKRGTQCLCHSCYCRNRQGRCTKLANTVVCWHDSPRNAQVNCSITGYGVGCLDGGR